MPCCGAQVLQQVYIDDTNIDEDLVDSIVRPAQDPNAAEVFYRIITGKGTPVNQLLARLDKPLLLLWGAQDPWCAATRPSVPGPLLPCKLSLLRCAALLMHACAAPAMHALPPRGRGGLFKGLLAACLCRITPRSADRIVSLYPSSRKVLIRGGHCPHDDAPQETNAQLLKWLAALD